MWVHIGCCLLLSAISGIGAAIASPANARAPNPHWKPDGCAACHAVEDGLKLPIAPENVDQVCLICHDGQKSAAEVHPVGGAFNAAEYRKPEHWPLAGERLSCITCHDLKMGCDEQIRRPNLNRAMLRDLAPGRGKGTAFCQHCHAPADYPKLNPHLMLASDKKQIVESSCLFCHTEAPRPDAMQREGRPLLKAGEAALCRDCHPRHRESMRDAHLGRKLSDEVIAYMYAREMTGLNSVLKPGLLAEIKRTGKRPLRMPPDAEGAITCSTCHSVHEAGVFPPGSVLGHRGMRRMEDGRMISPVRGENWCRHCHEI